jgi:hypothetical protein
LVIWETGTWRNIFLGWPQTEILLISASQVARIIGMNHQAPSSPHNSDFISYPSLSCLSWGL